MANGLSREDAVAALSQSRGSLTGAIEFQVKNAGQVGGGFVFWVGWVGGWLGDSNARSSSAD